MGSDRLQKQLHFLAEIDRLKSVLRRNRLIDGSRHENSAEHSWHISMLAVVLAEYANAPVDLLHVIKMLLIHDLVEIEAGDTFCYDEAALADQQEREQAAAERLFAMLPSDQAGEFHALWQEFEERTTPDAKFANALDRLQPVLLNYKADGGTWTEYAVPIGQVMQRNRPIQDGSTDLWQQARTMINQVMERRTV